MTGGKALVLFGHGARDPQWADPMKRLQAMLIAQLPTVRVELAFLELMQPGLPEAVQGLISQGVDEIRVVPIFFGKGGHLKNDFPALLAQLRVQHHGVQILATSAVGQWDAVWRAIAEEIIQQME